MFMRMSCVAQLVVHMLHLVQIMLHLPQQQARQMHETVALYLILSFVRA